jgi:hypothetical protein
MTRSTPQREIVAQLLRSNGSRGVHTFELRRAFIANPSERVADLEREGWLIDHKREPLNGNARGCRYTLVSSPSGAVERDRRSDALQPRGVRPAVPLSGPGAIGGRMVEEARRKQQELFEPEATPHWRAS